MISCLLTRCSEYSKLQDRLTELEAANLELELLNSKYKLKLDMFDHLPSKLALLFGLTATEATYLAALYVANCNFITSELLGKISGYRPEYAYKTEIMRASYIRQTTKVHMFRVSAKMRKFGLDNLYLNNKNIGYALTKEAKQFIDAQLDLTN